MDCICTDYQHNCCIDLPNYPIINIYYDGTSITNNYSLYVSFSQYKCGHLNFKF